MSAWLEAVFLDPLRQGWFQSALVGGCLVAVVSAVVGCLVILRRMAFLGDALSHAMIAGVAGGYLAMKLLFGLEAHAPGMLLGSLLAAVATVFLIGLVSRVSRVKEDTAIGIMYTGIFAAGVVVVSIFRSYIHIDLMHFIMGDVLSVNADDLWASAVAAALVLSVILLFFRHFQLASFDPVMAAAIGLPVVLLDYVLTTCVSLVVVSAVSMVGVILVVGLLITPAATAYLLSDRLGRMMWLAALFGITSVVGGLYLCTWVDSAGGGAIMLFCTLQFLVVLVVAPRYGILARWLRLRRMVPQQTVEDILAVVLRHEPVSELTLCKQIPREENVRRAARQLARERLLEREDDAYRLSDAGRKEALRIRRSHRLWEAYLAHVGTPEEEIHPRALELEHVHETASIDYLDDLLGHPETDPHGQPIPQDAMRFAAGSVVGLALLREGQEAQVARIGGAAGDCGLQPGEPVHVLPRENGGETWVVRTADGREFRLAHSQADAVLVTC